MVGWEYRWSPIQIEDRVGVPTSIGGILYIYIEGGWEYLLVLVKSNTDSKQGGSTY